FCAHLTASRSLLLIKTMVSNPVLLIIGHHSRHRFGKLQLIANLLQTRGECFDLFLLLCRRGLEVLSLLRRRCLEVFALLRHPGLQLSDGYFLFLDGAMLLEELI